MPVRDQPPPVVGDPQHHLAVRDGHLDRRAGRAGVPGHVGQRLAGDGNQLVADRSRDQPSPAGPRSARPGRSRAPARSRGPRRARRCAATPRGRTAGRRSSSGCADGDVEVLDGLVDALDDRRVRGQPAGTPAAAGRWRTARWMTRSCRSRAIRSRSETSTSSWRSDIAWVRSRNSDAWSANEPSSSVSSISRTPRPARTTSSTPLEARCARSGTSTAVRSPARVTTSRSVWVSACSICSCSAATTAATSSSVPSPSPATAEISWPPWSRRWSHRDGRRPGHGR